MTLCQRRDDAHYFFNSIQMNNTYVLISNKNVCGDRCENATLRIQFDKNPLIMIKLQV